MRVHRDQMLNTWEPEANDNQHLIEISFHGAQPWISPPSGAAGLFARIPLILAIQMLRQPESFHTNPRQRKKSDILYP